VRVGVISDTHGLLRLPAVAALRGSDLIVHAGDVGAPEVLAGLAAIAPVVAVRGNNDCGAWAERLRRPRWSRAGEALLYLLRVKGSTSTAVGRVRRGHRRPLASPGDRAAGRRLFVNQERRPAPL
jgi:hypothetical protein